MNKNYIDIESSVLYRCNQKYYDKVLSEYGLGYSQFVFLSSIFENEGLMMNDLAISGAFDKGSITKAIAKLEENGFVRIVDSKKDKRVKQLYTTTKTRDLMPKIYAIRQDWIRYLSSELNEEDIASFNKAMEKIVDKAREYEKRNIDSENIKFADFKKMSLNGYDGCISSIVYVGGCNFRCPFCKNKNLVFLDPSRKQFSGNEILNYLNDKKKMIDALVISGGEPLIADGLIDFLNQVKEIGLKIKIETNGSNFEKLKEIIELGLVDYVSMNIINTLYSYRKSTGTNSFNTNDILKSIEYLKEGRVDYEFKTVVTKEYHSNSDFNKIGELLKGSKKYVIENYSDRHLSIEDGLHGFSSEQMERIKQILRPYVEILEVKGIGE